MKCVHFILLLFVASVVADSKKDSVRNTDLVRLVPWFDCMSRPIGHYLHPKDCTRFIVCDAAFRAFEFDCPECTHKPAICSPLGRLIYNATLNQCLGKDETRCTLG